MVGYRPVPVYRNFLCLGDKLRAEIVEDPNESYGLIYMGVSRILEMKSHIWIYAFMSRVSQKKRFVIMLM